MWISEYKLLCLYRAGSSRSRPFEDDDEEPPRGKKAKLYNSDEFQLSRNKKSSSEESSDEDSSEEDSSSNLSDPLQEQPSRVKYYSDQDIDDITDNLEKILINKETSETPHTPIVPIVRSLLNKSIPTTLSDTNFLTGVLFVLNSRSDQTLYAYIRKIFYKDGKDFSEVCLVNKRNQEPYDTFITNFNEKNNVEIVKVFRENYNPVYWKRADDSESDHKPFEYIDNPILKYWLSLGYLHLPPTIELLLFKNNERDTRNKTYYINVDGLKYESYISYDFYLQIRDKTTFELRDMTKEEILKLNNI